MCQGGTLHRGYQTVPWCQSRKRNARKNNKRIEEVERILAQSYYVADTSLPSSAQAGTQ
eukprot:gene1247-2705_t